jgi:hypothetical protein
MRPVPDSFEVTLDDPPLIRDPETGIRSQDITPAMRAFSHWTLMPGDDDDGVWLCPECIRPEERQAVDAYWRRVADVTPVEDSSDPRGDPL